MHRNVIIAFAVAALLSAGYFASEALARGGGGGGRGGHGGMGSGWHGLAGHGAHNMHGGHNMFGHMSRGPSNGQHAHGMQNFGHNMHMHHQSLAQGQWHSVPGFGSHGQKSANMPGMWHKVPGFGSHGQKRDARDFRRDWQASGGGWAAVGSVGDICVNATMCQGVWQVVPQSSSRESQTRGIKKDWQVGEEL